MRASLLAAGLLVVVAACGADAPDAAVSATTEIPFRLARPVQAVDPAEVTRPVQAVDSAEVTRPVPAVEPAVPAPGDGGHDASGTAAGALGDLVRPGPSALPQVPPATASPAPLPVALMIPAIDVVDAPVVAVGVRPDAEMEVPAGDHVGWYRFGPRPGDAGSAVLAAHVAFDGREGLFRRLGELEAGDRLSVVFDDGTAREFEAVERAQYGKDQLPLDRIFAEQGGATLALVTCGGTFDRSLRSYADNVVVYAVPVGG